MCHAADSSFLHQLIMLQISLFTFLTLAPINPPVVTCSHCLLWSEPITCESQASVSSMVGRHTSRSPGSSFAFTQCHLWQSLAFSPLLVVVMPPVDIKCLCTLAVLCGAFAVITSAVSFPGWSGDLWLLCYTVFLCLLCLYSWNFCAQSLFSSVSDTGHKVCIL